MNRTATDGYAPSPHQERSWRLAHEGLDLWGVRALVDLQGTLQPERLARALDAALRRHEILRTSLVVPEGLDAPLQVIDPGPVQVTLAAVEPVASLDQEWPEDLSPWFAPLAAGAGSQPGLRCALWRLGAQRHALALGLPATHADAATALQLVSELAQAYAGEAPADSAGPAPAQHADVADWQLTRLESEAHTEDRTYWSNVTAGALRPFLFAQPRGAGAFQAACVPIDLDPELAELARRVAAAHDATLSEVLQAAWLALAWRLNGSSELAVLHDGRRHAELRSAFGPLARYLPQRHDVTRSSTLADLVRELRLRNHEARRREEFYAWQDGARSQSAIAFEFFDCSRTLDASGVTFAVRRLDALCDPFQIKLAAAAEPDRLAARIWFDRRAFAPRDVHVIAACFPVLLRGLLTHPAVALGSLAVAPVAQTQRELAWSRGRDLEPAAVDATSVYEVFQQAARATPAGDAVLGAGETLSYAELERRTRVLAAVLRARGVGPGVVVAVIIRRAMHVPVAFFGVLAAGAAYVPIDPDIPPARLDNLLAEAHVALVLTDEAAGLAGHDRELLDLATLDLGGQPDPERCTPVPGHELAYVMYTSGSSGRPKGVMVTRANLLYSTRARHQCYGREARFALLSPHTFDSSVAGLYGTLCGSGTLLLPSEQERQHPAQLVEFLVRYEASHLLMVPSLYAVLLAHAGFVERAARTLRCVIVAGEACPADLVRRHRESLPGVPLYNEYGPTEATVWATMARLDQDASDASAAAAVSIGHPIPGTRVLLLDASFEPVLPGAVGELFVGGPGVARGYLGQPALTAASFVPCPFDAGQRLYRTGDLARRGQDGALLFEGRGDEQIKINGYRIEPAEIEAVLRAVPGVGEALVVAITNARDTRTLVACIESERALTPQGLREHIQRHLPAHLLPAGFVIVRALPRTRTDKLDRAACRELASGELSRAPSRSPQTALELRLAELWQELLDVDAVGLDDNFFTLGGHSLLAVQLLARVRDLLGCEIRLPELFESPTIGGLARRIEQGHGRAATALDLRGIAPDAAARYEPFPLNSIQEAYWVGRKEGFELGNVGSTNYFEFDVAALDLGRFEAALRALIERHDMLRATIHPDGFQQVAGEVPPYVVATYDLRQTPDETRQRSLDETRTRMSLQSLRTDRWPLFEIAIHQLPDRTRLHIATELVVCDAVSSRILLRDLYHLYHHAEQPLPALDLRFRDYVVAERALRASDRFERAKAYWLAKLEALPPAPELPLAKDPRQVASPHFSTLKHELTPTTWSQLKRRAAGAGVTPTAVLATAYATVLATWAKASQFTLNLTTYTRLPFHPQVHDIVGDFTSLTMIEVQAAEGRFSERVRRVQQEIWQNLDHGEFGGVDVMRELRRLHGNGSRALMPVVFTSQLGMSASDDPAARRWLGNLVFSSGQAPQVWIDHQVAEPEGRLQFWWDYLDELFPAGLVEQIFECYCAFIEDLARSDEPWLLATLDPWRMQHGQAALPAQAEPVDVALFPSALIHTGFLEQARQQAAAQALTWSPSPGVVQDLSYGDLRDWAWRIATHVRQLPSVERAAGTTEVVVILLPKGWEHVPAALGVCWAGAAYAPLDVSWPPSRVAEVLEQTRCRLVIGTRAERERCTHTRDVLWLCLDEWLEGHDSPGSAAAHWRSLGTDGLGGPSASRPLDPGPAQTTDLAYVIYTSGSTGVPKGVMIEHGAACITLAEVARRWQVRASDRVLALSALSFDLSVFDIFAVLAVGGTIVMPEESQRRDPAAWLRLCGEQAVTLWNSVPALLEMAVESMEGQEPAARRWPGPLRLALLSGDWIPLTLPERLRALARQATVVSLGGATEASIWSIAHDLEGVAPALAATWRSIPYGKALAGQTMQVLRGGDTEGHHDLTPCPPWVTGHIYIGGGGLARGYWGNPEETERRFVRDARTGQRLYDTGDLGRWLPDGTIELLGRADQQVKIQGYRVELGEIEATLAKHPEVSAAAVRVFDGPTGVSKHLVGYLVPRERAEAPSAPLSTGAIGDAPAAEPPAASHGKPVRPELQRWLTHLEFKLARPGQRRWTTPPPQLALPQPGGVGDSASRSLFRRRRTSRWFDQNNALTVEQLGAWLDCLRESADGDAFQREYPSAGSLYAVQTYLYVKPSAVSGLPAGMHYYDPSAHGLVHVERSIALVRELYDPVNRGVFDRAAFALLLVGKLAAVKPLYDDAARDFCLVEAGCMTQLLMTCAPEHRIGVCPIGGLAFDHVRAALDVDEDHVLLHSLLGGALLPVEAATPSVRPPRPRPASVPAAAAAEAPAPARAGEFVDRVRGFARQALPEYLVPARFVVIERLPLSSNGKVDRARLPAPAATAESKSFTPPRTDTEKAVAAMWMELLRLPDLGVHDDFFALGGDSIISVRFINRVRERFHVELPLREFLGAASVESVAGLIERLVIDLVAGLDEDAVQGLLS